MLFASIFTGLSSDDVQLQQVFDSFKVLADRRR